MKGVAVAVSMRVQALMEKGVRILLPESVHVDDDVDLERISSKDVVIHPGCRIKGPTTLVMAGARLGEEGPLTIEDCQIGPHVELRGGSARRSVFMEGAGVGPCAQIREACILEEYASCAHSVGLKHTILFPFVTLGSLVNFCDCLMAGGTGKKDHSEVGSSYIHFNFTPHQDKATASLIGDVPRGVMLREHPIFLGGQGGLVGPSMIAYGTVIAAGVVFRGSLHEENKIIKGLPAQATKKKYVPGLITAVKEKVTNNITYIANLIALRAWYLFARPILSPGDPMSTMLLESAVEKIDMAIDERVARLEAFIDKIPASLIHLKGPSGTWASPVVLNQQEELFRNWAMIADEIQALRSYAGDDGVRELFLAELLGHKDSSVRGYVEAVKALPDAARTKGTEWLSGIVRTVTSRCLEKIPSFIK